MVFASEWLHINDFELLWTVPGTEFRRASFLCSKKPPVFIISLFFWAQGPWGPGPWSPLGPMGPPHSQICLKICKRVRDLSKSVPMVFRSPGKALIKLFHFIFNSECHFQKCVFSYNSLLAPRHVCFKKNAIA